MRHLARGLRFRPRWWGLALALAVSFATVQLGHWQSGRADEKRLLAERLDNAERSSPVDVPGAPDPGLAYRHLRATGEYLPQFTILLDNKVHRGRPGYYVVTPMRLMNSSMHLLVNRGWIAAGSRREDLPTVPTPSGTVTVEGVGLEHVPRVFGAGAPPPGRVWPTMTYEEFAAWSGLALQPVFLEQHSSAADGLVRDWPKADFGVEKHESYAIQWYLMAAVSIVIFFVLSFERVRPGAR